jgi:hypothetical protein
MLRIWVNGERLTPWDPFARSEPLTQGLEEQRVPVRHGGAAHTIIVRPYILPPQARFSSAAAHEAAAGPGRWNRQQGLYIYRRDRLIQSGGWSRLRTLDEHSKLARVAIDLPVAADGAFAINVSKMRVSLPPETRPALRTILSGVVQRAQDTYRQRLQVLPGGRPPSSTEEPPARAESWRLADHWSLISEVLERELADHPVLVDRILLALANAGTRPTASVPTAQEHFPGGS